MSLILRPCPACARHVRRSEASCPFCDGPLGDSFRDDPEPVPALIDARKGLHRHEAARLRLLAASVGVGVLTAAALAACGNSGPTPDYGVPDGGGIDAHDDDAHAK